MKPYSEYSAEELAMENLFIRWVRYPNDPDVGRFWEGWVAKYPHMLGTVATAKALVINASEIHAESISGEEANSLWNRIRTTIETFPEIRSLDSNVRNIAGKLYYLRWSVGIASTILIILILIFTGTGKQSSWVDAQGMEIDSSAHLVKPDTLLDSKGLFVP